MPADWIPNCGTQLERAIRALFVEAGAATVDDCFISNESGERGDLETGVTTILAHSSTHDPETTGNEVYQVTIHNKFGAALQPGESDISRNRVLMDKRVGRQMLALMQGGTESSGLRYSCSDLTTYGRALYTIDPESNEDMEEFTALYLRFTGSTRGRPDDASCAWVEVRNFEITCCPTNVD